MDTLYHYCNNDTFLRIIESQSLRLSALSLSNDKMEGRLLHRAILALAANNELDLRQQQLIAEHLSFIEPLFEGLGICLSEEGDLLSQWRAYTNDAKGMSIGFNKEYFAALTNGVKSMKLLKVEYIDVAEVATLKPLQHLYDSIVDKVRKVPDRNPFRRGLLNTQSQEEFDAEAMAHALSTIGLRQAALALYRDLYAFKGKGFAEEREWRILYPCIAEPGGQFDVDVPFSFDGFAAKDDKFVPFKLLRRREEITIPWINKVYIGPKNTTPVHVVKSALRKYGFPDVEVLMSATTYR